LRCSDDAGLCYGQACGEQNKLWIEIINSNTRYRYFYDSMID
jgi:hypothetical protein